MDTLIRQLHSKIDEVRTRPDGLQAARCTSLTAATALRVPPCLSALVPHHQLPAGTSEMFLLRLRMEEISREFQVCTRGAAHRGAARL